MPKMPDGVIIFSGDVTIQAKQSGRFNKLRVWGYEYADVYNQRYDSDPEKYAPGQPESIQEDGFYPLGETVLWAVDGSDGAVHLGQVTFDCQNVEGLVAIANVDPSQRDPDGRPLTGGHQVWQRITIRRTRSYGFYAPPRPTGKKGQVLHLSRGAGPVFFPKLLQATTIDSIDVKLSSGAICGFRNTTDGAQIRSLTVVASGVKTRHGGWAAPIHLSDTNLFLGYMHIYGRAAVAAASQRKESFEVDSIRLERGAFLHADYAHIEGNYRYPCSCGDDANVKFDYLKLGSGAETISRYSTAILFEGTRGRVEVASVERNIDNQVWKRVVDLKAKADGTYNRLVRIQQPFAMLALDDDSTAKTKYSMFPVAYTEDSDHPNPRDQIYVESTEGIGVIARQNGVLRYRVMTAARALCVTVEDGRYVVGANTPSVLFVNPDQSSGVVQITVDVRHKFLNGEQLEIRNAGKQNGIVFQPSATTIPPGAGQKFQVFEDQWSKL
jgi:hypothetical protein